MNTEPETLAPGTIIADRYRLDGLLGRGGFGAVFAATRVGGGRAAVKILSRRVLDQTGGEARFHREAELARRLSHPNTVRVLDAGTDPRGVLFIAFELLEGRSVEKALQDDGPMAPRRAVEIALAVLDALEEAHAVGVIHRDIKPANLFLVSAGPMVAERIKVLDFGIAKSTNPSTRAGLTREGTTMGTPVYMSPEQVLGQDVGPQSDLFALGIVLGEMIEGGSLYGTEPSGLGIMTDRISGKSIPFPPALLASPLGPVLTRATSAALSTRFASASEMRLALLEVLPSLALHTSSDRKSERATMRSPGSSGAAMSTIAGAPTEMSVKPGPSDSGPAYHADRSPQAASVALSSSPAAPQPAIAPPPPTPPTISSQPVPDFRVAPPAHAYGPPVMTPVRASSSNSSVVLWVVGAVVLFFGLFAVAGAIFYVKSASAPRSSTTEPDDESEPTEPSPPEPKRRKPAPPPPTDPSPDPRAPRPTPQPRVSSVHERACPEVDAMNAPAIGPAVRAAGLTVESLLSSCEGNLINFECDGLVGVGVVARSADGHGNVKLIASPSHASLEQFIAGERNGHDDEETILVGKTKVVVIGFGEPYASRIAARFCH